ncbi:hypothetical protein HDU97_000731 [Phlyctochytrium planicorne]|nr:hypothetical protein HDU97_000731 [Phlyctochytrium planicorne]
MQRQLGSIDRAAGAGSGGAAPLAVGKTASDAGNNPPPSPSTSSLNDSSNSNERIRSVLQFEDCFWGNGDDPTIGVKTLYDLITKHLNEVEEIVVAVKQRIAIEEGYAFRVNEFAKILQTFTLNSGFIGAASHSGMQFGGAVPYGGISLASGPGPVWSGHGIDYANFPPSMGPSGLLGSPTDGLPSSATPGDAFNPARRRSSATDNNGSTGSSNQTLSSPTAAASPSTTTPEDQGSTLYQSQDKPGGGATQTDESSLFPVLRNWGRILNEMTSSNRRHADTLSLAVLTPLQAFVSQHRKIMERKKAEVDTHHRTVTKLHSEIAQKRNNHVTKSKHASSLAEQKRKAGGDGDDGVQRAQRDADLARVDYQNAITAAEHARSALEFHITDFLMWSQETEYYRLKVAREAFLALESAQLFTVEAHTRLWTVDVDPDTAHSSSGGHGGYAASSTASSDENGPPPLRLVTPSPSHGIENIAMRLRTGSRHSPPFVYDPYVAPVSSIPTPPGTPPSKPSQQQSPASSPRQAFGIPLDDLARATGDPIPPVVRKCVAALSDASKTKRLRSGLDAWIMPNPDLPSVHFMRLEFNGSLGGSRVAFSRITRETPAVVAGVLKLFLVETPTSLCNFEVYDTMKILYSNAGEGEEETMIRIKSVSSLLTTLSPAHYETLKIFAGLMHETVKNIEPTDKRLRRLAYSIAPCIIRPKQETSQTLADEHPYLLTMDLLLHFPEMFGGALPNSYFEAPPTPPASPEPEEDEEIARGSRLKATSSLNLREVAGAGVGGAWRGLVKSVSNLNLRGGGSVGGAKEAASGSGSVGVLGNVVGGSTTSPVNTGPQSGGDAPTGGNWFSWGRSASQSASPSTPVKKPLTPTSNMMETLLHESDLDLDHEADVGGEDMDLHPCHWAGCRAVLPSPESLIEHLRVEHMKVNVGGVRVGDGGSNNDGLNDKARLAAKRTSTAVLPVLDDEEGDGGAVGGNSVMERVEEGEEGEEGQM